MTTYEITGPGRNRADLSNYRDQRVLALWEVALLSLGIEPNEDNVAEVKLNSKYGSLLKRRIQLLARKLSEIPGKGYVTFFPWHEYNKGSTSPESRMVDVVSCIDVLRKTVSDEPSRGLFDLRETLSGIALPVDPNAPPKLIRPPSSNLVSKPQLILEVPIQGSKGLATEAKKDQTKAIKTKAIAQCAGLLYAVVRHAYGYVAGDDLSEKKVFEDIFEALKQSSLHNSYGMSSTAISLLLKEGHALSVSAQLAQT